MNIFLRKTSFHVTLPLMTKIKLQAFRTTAAKTGAKGGRGPGGTVFHCKPLKRFDPEKKMKGNERNSACFRSILEHHFLLRAVLHIPKRASCRRAPTKQLHRFVLNG